MCGRERENMWEVNTREERRLREKGAKSPTEYRDWEAAAQTNCMNGAVGEKRKQEEGLKERCEDGVLRQWFCQRGQFVWSQAYLQIRTVMKG